MNRIAKLARHWKAANDRYIVFRRDENEEGHTLYSDLRSEAEAHKAELEDELFGLVPPKVLHHYGRERPSMDPSREAAFLSEHARYTCEHHTETVLKHDDDIVYRYPSQTVSASEPQNLLGMPRLRSDLSGVPDVCTASAGVWAAGRLYSNT